MRETSEKEEQSEGRYCLTELHTGEFNDPPKKPKKK